INERQKDFHVVPEDRQKLKKELEAHDVVREFETQVYRRDGSKIWISMNARAVRDREGKILFYEGSTQEITLRKKAETRRHAFHSLGQRLSSATTPKEAAKSLLDIADE